MSADTKKPWAGPLLRTGSVPTFDLNNPTDWVIPGILPRRGTALVTGVSGALKTSFTIHVLHNMAHGEDDCPDYRNEATHTHGPAPDGGLRRTFVGPSVSFIALEAEEQTEATMRALRGLVDCPRGWHLRADGLAISSCIGTENTQFIRPNASDCPEVFNICAATEDDTDQLYRFMGAAHDGAEFGWGESDVTVVDSIGQALAGRPENSSETMSAACKGLKLLQPKRGLVIGIHHGDASHNQWHSRGHTALPSGVDHIVNIKRDKHNVVTVRNLKARGFASGVVRRYQAVLKKWTDIEADGRPEYAAWAFEEMPPEEPKATPTTSTSEATRAPPDAPAKPVKADAPPAAPKAPEGPKLRGLPAKVWQVLALVPGQRMAMADARELVVNSSAFADVDTARRAQRWGEVVESFEAKGLVVDGHLTHPEQPPPEDDLL